MEYDDIVVGAGSAGAVIAARLSQDPDRRVLLLEAGPDYASAEATPGDLLDASVPVMTGHNWSINARIREESALQTLQHGGLALLASNGSDRFPMLRTAARGGMGESNVVSKFDYAMGRVSGGSSATNGAIAFPGVPDDFAEWAAAGNDAWDWNGVVPFFRKLEDDRDGIGPWGRGGPLPITRIKRADFLPVQASFFEACRELGYPEAADLYDPMVSGVGGAPKNVDAGRRISTAIAYLGPARKRGNLEILSGALVNRVIFKGNRAAGVEVLVDGAPREIFARRITLSAGAVFTPAILVRSGIGAQAEVRRIGQEPLVDSPGVGRNLADHSSVGIWCVPVPGGCRKGDPFHQAMLRCTAPGSSEHNDMQLYMLSGVDTALFPMLRDSLGAPLVMAVTVVVAKPRSRGRVETVSADPSVAPRVLLNCAKHPADLQRIMQGLRLAWQIIHRPGLKSHVSRMFMWNQRIMDSDALLSNMISAMVRGAWHPVGTAKMGPGSDPAAVADQFGRVHGCQGLRVADASIMPTIPRAPTNLTCIMIGEKIADHMRQHEG